MTTVKIDYSVSSDAVSRVKAALKNEALHNPDWNGADFVVERDEYTCVEDCDEIQGAALLHSVIFPAIDNE